MPPSKLKIGFVIDDSLDRPDGVQQYILCLGQWLQHQGHEVHYLVGETKRTDLPNVHSLAKNFRVRFNKNALSIPLPANKANIKNLLAKLQLDILHVQMPYHPLLAARVIKASGNGTAVFGTFHILPNSRLEYTATQALGRWLKSTLGRFDMVYGVSPPACDFVRDAFHLPAAVMPNVVDISAIKKAEPKRTEDGTLSVIFLGRLVKRKGCGYLLEALTKLDPGIRQKITVTILGGGPLETKLKNYAEQHNLVSEVRFAGFVTEQQKAAYLSGADIAVFPATGGESFGIVLIEAMAAGAEVVLGGNNAGYRSVLEDPRVLFRPENTGELARLLTEYIGSTSLRQAIHTEQQARVKLFDVAVVGPKIVADYHKMIAKRRNY